MNRRTTFLVVLMVALVGATALGAGTGIADEGDEYCEDVDSQTVVGVFMDDVVTGDYETEVYTNSTFELAYCDENHELEDDDWLDDGDGYEADNDDGIYTIDITATSGEIAFADDLSEEVIPAPGEVTGLTVTVTSPSADSEELDASDAFAEAEDDVGAALDELEDVTETLNASDETIDFEATENTLNELENATERMIEAENEFVAEMVHETRNGTASAPFETLRGIETDRSDRNERTDDTLAAYTEAIEQERTDTRGDVRFWLFTPLVGGLLVGAVAGSVVPFVAARRIEDKMKLSRDVTYDRKSVLIPAVVGLVLAMVGVVILLWQGEGGTLLEVIR